MMREGLYISKAEWKEEIQGYDILYLLALTNDLEHIKPIQAQTRNDSGLRNERE